MSGVPSKYMQSQENPQSNASSPLEQLKQRGQMLFYLEH